MPLLICSYLLISSLILLLRIWAAHADIAPSLFWQVHSLFSRAAFSFFVHLSQDHPRPLPPLLLALLPPLVRSSSFSLLPADCCLTFRLLFQFRSSAENDYDTSIFFFRRFRQLSSFESASFVKLPLENCWLLKSRLAMTEFWTTETFFQYDGWMRMRKTKILSMPCYREFFWNGGSGRIIYPWTRSFDTAGTTAGPTASIFSKSIQWIDISNNMLAGTIPTSWYSPQNLNFLYLNKNRPTGTLSKEIGELHNLLTIFLSGEIPLDIGKMKILGEYIIQTF